MKYRNRLLAIAAVIWLAAVFCVLKAHAQFGSHNNTQAGDYYNNDGARNLVLEICHIIQVPVTGGGAGLGYYGTKVHNTSASKLYVCTFDSASQPSNGVVAPGGCDDIGANASLYVDTGGGAVGFNNGIAVCLSTTDATFTAATAVGEFWTLYRGVASTPTSTPTVTGTATFTPTATATVAGGTPTATKTATPTFTPTAVPPTATSTPAF